MARTKTRKSFLKKLRKGTKKAIPVVSKGLKNVGRTTKKVVVKSAPYIEKGVAGVYDTLATGFDMGIKGAKKVIKMNKNKTRRR
jgi:hypothetical protein